MEQRISLITLGVGDIERSARFYEDLGWHRVETPDGVVAFDLIGQTLGLYALSALADEIGVAVDSLGHGAMTVSHNLRSKPEVDALILAAKRAGGTVLKRPCDVFWGGYHGYFADPDGHIWEIAHNPYSPLSAEGKFRWNGYPGDTGS